MTAIPSDGIQPFYGTVGNVYLSVDGVADPSGQGDVLVDKREGATVVRAFLLGSGVDSEGSEAYVDNQLVFWDRVETSPWGFGSFYGYSADITGIVKPIIDAAEAGLVSISLDERVQANRYEGLALAVVLNDASLSDDNSILLYFGGQKTTGEESALSFGAPVDLDALRSAVFGLGIGYSFNSGTSVGQSSEVRINDQLLTTIAGNADDGYLSNGGLFTVGGVGDSPLNPDPNSINILDDDELYDLTPFIAQGDTSIRLFSINPSNDDHIFFAHLTLAGASGRLSQVVEVDQEFVAAPDVPISVQLTEGSTLTPSLQPDIIAFPDAPVEKPVVVRATLAQLAKDVIVNFAIAGDPEVNKLRELRIQSPPALDRLKVKKGSAIFWDDIDGNGELNLEELSFKLEGNFDLDRFKLEVDPSTAELVITYAGVLLPDPISDPGPLPPLQEAAAPPLAPQQPASESPKLDPITGLFDSLSEKSRADIFSLTKLNEPRSFILLSQKADQLVGAPPPVLDSFDRRSTLLILDANAFGVEQIRFKDVKGDRSLRQAAGSKANFIFDRRSGDLIFDANGNLPGLGDGGGVIASIDPSERIRGRNLVLFPSESLGLPAPVI